MIVLCFFSVCGESEIRTREPVLPVTRFPGVPLQPLEHLSLYWARWCETCLTLRFSVTKIAFFSYTAIAFRQKSFDFYAFLLF